MMNDTILTIKNLHVSISVDPPIHALEGIDLTVQRGEILGLIGESGAGKSLIGSAIANLLVSPLQISQGSIELDSQRIDTLTERQMERVRGTRIGMIFQDPMTSLNPVLTVGHQLTETIRTHLKLGRVEGRARAVEWLKRVGLPAPEDMLSRYPHEFSGGMRQRIVIALALCAEPDLVIADEPTTALDVSVQAQILSLLRELHRETGVTVILITHDMGVLAQMADRVAVIYSGHVVELGRTSEIVEHSQHPYTIGLMRSIVDIDTPVATLFQIEGSMPRPSDRPSGCAFHPRCPRMTQRCHNDVPALEGNTLHRTACWHPGQTSGTEGTPKIEAKDAAC